MPKQHELIQEFVNYPSDDYRNDILDAIDIGIRGIPVRAAERIVTGGVI